jgi:hypothetical protein
VRIADHPSAENGDEVGRTMPRRQRIHARRTRFVCAETAAQLPKLLLALEHVGPWLWGLCA